MDKKLINRRAFFKKAACAALPIIAAITVPSLLSSCEIDEPYYEEPSGCKSCKGGCSGSCGTSCSFGCKANSSNGSVGCNGSCKGHCSGLCKGSCYGKAK